MLLVKQTTYFIFLIFIGSPTGNRTPDSTVRGWRLNLLTIGPHKIGFIFRLSLVYINKLKIARCFALIFYFNLLL